MISYAQNAEDVVLDRAFKGRDHGFYIDVGAADPTNHSVTRHFYDKGWRGVNIDPLPAWHERLKAERPGDVNLLLGVSSAPGQMVLHVGAEHPGGATFNPEQGREYRSQGMNVTEVNATVTTLADVCGRWARGRVIDFLKIDAEGYERRVIEGADWNRWRPRVVVVEATEPNSSVPNHENWEPLLLKADYIHALFDGLNRFYVRREDAGLLQLIRAPANVFDDYTPHRFVREADTAPPIAPIAKEGEMPEYEFDRLGMNPGRLGSSVRHVRRVLRRLQRPWFDRQVEILYQLRGEIDVGEARIAVTEAELETGRQQIAALRAEVAELRSQVVAQEARSWDQAAIARQLAALEDATRD